MMASALAPGGRILIVFGPPWFAPYGSHMQFFTPLPWVNLLFGERTVMRVRSRYKKDGARRYEEVEGGLNRMSLSKLEGILDRSGLVVVWSHYRAVKGIRWLVRIPILRELFTSQVALELAMPAVTASV